MLCCCAQEEEIAASRVDWLYFFSLVKAGILRCKVLLYKGTFHVLGMM